MSKRRSEVIQGPKKRRKAQTDATEPPVGSTALVDAARAAIPKVSLSASAAAATAAAAAASSPVSRPKLTFADHLQDKINRLLILLPDLVFVVSQYVGDPSSFEFNFLEREELLQKRRQLDKRLVELDREREAANVQRLNVCRSTGDLDTIHELQYFRAFPPVMFVHLHEKPGRVGFLEINHDKDEGTITVGILGKQSDITIRVNGWIVEVFEPGYRSGPDESDDDDEKLAPHKLLYLPGTRIPLGTKNKRNEIDQKTLDNIVSEFLIDKSVIDLDAPMTMEQFKEALVSCDGLVPFVALRLLALVVRESVLVCALCDTKENMLPWGLCVDCSQKKACQNCGAKAVAPRWCFKPHDCRKCVRCHDAHPCNHRTSPHDSLFMRLYSPDALRKVYPEL